MYKDVEQFERLLRAIYRPHNFYCVHVDLKASVDVRKGVDAVTSCFDNVFTAPDSLDVRWGNISVLEAESCVYATFACEKEVEVIGQTFCY